MAEARDSRVRADMQCEAREQRGEDADKPGSLLRRADTGGK